jgi:hypothetical protein
MTRYFQLPLIHAPLSPTTMLMSVGVEWVCEVVGRMGVDVAVMMVVSEANGVWEAIESDDVFAGSDGFKGCRIFGRLHDSLKQL